WRESLNPKDNWGPSWHKTAPASSRKISQANLTPDEIAFNNWVAEILYTRPTGTINCLAVDANGDISGVTTTSGLAWKIAGRVGDSPIIGAGLYVDNEVGAAGSTGAGEECIKICGAHTIVENLRKGMSPKEAGIEALHRIIRNHNNDRNKLRFIQMHFYILRNDGAYAGCSLWSHDDKGKRRHFCVHDGTKRLEESTFVFEGTPVGWPPTIYPSTTEPARGG